MKKIPAPTPCSTDNLLSRRNALQSVAGLASLAAVGAAGCGPAGPAGDGLDEGTSSVAPGGRRRVAIVGGGAGGIAAAYFLEGACDVVIFEARAKIGGHCDSQVVAYQGQPITVD